MRRGRPPLGLVCPRCGSLLVPTAELPAEGEHRLLCEPCGASYRARRRPSPSKDRGSRAVGGLDLGIRAGLIRLLPGIYDAGLGLGTAAMILGGGFVPLIGRWVGEDAGGPRGPVELMGGVRVARTSTDPDADLGPTLRRSDAPELFEEVAEIARRLGVRPPEEIRLAFLPCCGVVAWRRSRALLLGLPLLHALSLAELKAVLSHELAHLARGDATGTAGSLRFVEGLGRALDDPSGRSRGPLRLWARLCRSAGLALIGPIARGQEARADRASAAIAGGGPAASALVKVAMVQPLFRELLGQFDPGRAGGKNLYTSFREFWGRLPPPLLEALRLRALTRVDTPTGSPHPPLPERVAAIQAFPDRALGPADGPAIGLLGDPEWLEQMLHERLYGLASIERSVFHKAGS